ncbi:hypothetical protein A4H97_11880 [Niastella yeongjuensis]|uniref:DoxX family protein n=1 Tax=Niastella yeongjuensis TaxID=354355 RepID=A0A1V9E9N3_9BACT|nr:hypothetical protein [Niastella yeongjuensis]OQP42848.1 hypothetical protein A4H97_11880 [Niastella yeongjuensis]SEO56645.1 hypothetical protein SAMN05660816_03042 [Niastella yeongjuensis]
MSLVQNTFIETAPLATQVNDNGKARAAATTKPVATSWSSTQKILFRIAFIFFVCISIPNSVEWYKLVVHIDWTSLHYRDLYDIARFGSGINLFGNKLFGSTLLGYANWIITLIVAAAGGFIWTWIVNRRKTARAEYNLLYYWLRVVVRYRAGIGIIGFGFTKLLPVQMPYPSWGVLNTNVGDMTAQKLYWLSIGIVPWYQIFAGVVEVAAGSLLFFRRTTTIGSILLFGALGDIVYVNFAYDGGVHVYSSYFVLLAAFLLVNDLPKLYNLLILERDTVPVNFYPVFNAKWQRYGRLGLKAATIFIFLVVLFYLQLINFWYDPYKQPSVAGVKQLRGNYAVTEFRINNTPIAYNPIDTVRWQEATFEKWSSLTFRINKPTALDLSNGGGDPQRDINRTFELTGVAGGQRVFHYYADTINNVLYLEDKYKEVPDRRNRAAGVGGDGGTDKNLDSDRNKKKQEKAKKQKDTVDKFIPKEAWKNIGNEVAMIDKRAASTRRDREFAEAPKNEKRNRMLLHYETTDGSRVILKGVNENKDSIYVVLDRINRPYALSESSLQAGKY